ncbi:MAG: thiamine-monophosphate kinase, partial [Dehalococcoidia bacterium]
MKISELGEFGLIQLLAEVLGPPPHTPPHQPGILTGIGDDAALWCAPDSTQILTTDTMIEDVHFRRETISWRDLGWKTLAINISDIAAMGGIPQYAVVSLGLPPDTEVESVTEVYRGMADIAGKYDCHVVGGDTVTAPSIMITVSLTGEASSDDAYPDNVLSRS